MIVASFRIIVLLELQKSNKSTTDLPYKKYEVEDFIKKILEKNLKAPTNVIHW